MGRGQSCISNRKYNGIPLINGEIGKGNIS